MQTSRRTLSSLMSTRRLGERSFDSPSSRQARRDRPAVDAEKRRPLVSGACLSLIDQQTNGWTSDALLDTQGFDVGRTATQPCVNALVADTKVPRPFAHRSRLAVECQPSVTASIRGLLARRRPSTVARRVRTIVVDTVNRVLPRGARANFSSKRDERITPRAVHGDPASAIVAVVLTPRVIATILDCSPHLIEACAGFPMVSHTLKV